MHIRKVCVHHYGGAVIYQILPHSVENLMLRVCCVWMATFFTGYQRIKQMK